MFDSLYLALLLCPALLIIGFAFLRGNKNSAWGVPALVLLLFIVFVVLLYSFIGSWSARKHYQDKEVRAQEVQKLIKHFKTPEALIDKLKGQLTQEAKSAQGWYLLGRLYASQSQWLLARDAFQTALRLKPRGEGYRINEIVALWNINKQQFNPEIRRKLLSLLRQNPKQPDVLAMLAMDAYQQKHYQQAIAYWQVLVKLTPPDSEAAKALGKAILKAQEKVH